jgi:hypothetical protein
MCFSRSGKKRHGVSCVQEEQDLFLGTVSQHDGDDTWKVKIPVAGKEVKFKLDTGADVTVVPENCAPKPLQTTKKKLFGPNQSQLKVVGTFKATLKFGDVTSTQELYVVRGLREPLLGKPAIQALRILQFVQSIGEGTYKETELRQAHPKLFSGLGRMKEVYKIRQTANTVPYAVSAPRRVPLPLQEKVRAKLDELLGLDVIRPVTTPTLWCAPIVVIPKKDSKDIRLCVDLTKLNESVMRENYPLPSTDQLLAQLADAKVFTKLDCNSGFYQLPLDEASQELTTFITPFGRFCYKRLPFGISSGPEVFHRIMSQLLSNIPGVICDIDDVLISGRTQKEHDDRLNEVRRRLEDAGVTLNHKCAFSQTSIKFLGHIISKDGVQMDPTKLEAIQKMPPPQNVTELRRVLGMLNYVQKFVPELAEKTRPLRELLKKDIEWTWGQAQEKAFQDLKLALTSPPVLAHYSPHLPTKVSADASSYGLGAVLLQKKGEDWRPVFYASRCMTSTEQNYYQVEREALACMWACEKFVDFLLGLPSFILETDHKPLLVLLKTRALDEMSPRLQRFRMRLMRFNYQMLYTAGKNLSTADALSRAPVGQPDEADFLIDKDAQLFVESIISGLPVTTGRLVEIKRKQQEDQVCRKVMNYCRNGWPAEKHKVDPDVRPFFPSRSDMTLM